jgi:hypothetical protein
LSAALNLLPAKIRKLKIDTSSLFITAQINQIHYIEELEIINPRPDILKLVPTYIHFEGDNSKLTLRFPDDCDEIFDIMDILPKLSIESKFLHLHLDVLYPDYLNLFEETKRIEKTLSFRMFTNETLAFRKSEIEKTIYPKFCNT